MFYTGTRPGETFALQFKDIKGDYISINKTLTSHNGREFDDPKSFNSVRMIKLDKKLNVKANRFTANAKDILEAAEEEQDGENQVRER